MIAAHLPSLAAIAARTGSIDLVEADVAIRFRGRTYAWNISGGSIREGHTDTLWPLGSLTKVITTSLAMTCVQRGEVQLDQPIEESALDLVRWLPPELGALNLRQLLNHTSGLIDSIEFESYDKSIGEFFRNIPRPLTIAWPGEVYSYSNLNFDLAGRLAEIASGVSIEKLFKIRLAKPLGLRTAGFRRTGGLVASHVEVPSHRRASAGFWSSTSELVELMSIFSDSARTTEVLTRESLDAIYFPYLEDAGHPQMGLGVHLFPTSGPTVAGNSGGFPGFCAVGMVLRGEDFSMALCGRGPHATVLRSLAEGLVTEFTGYPFQSSHALDVTGPPIEALVGTYAHGPNVIRIEPADRKDTLGVSLSLGTRRWEGGRLQRNKVGTFTLTVPSGEIADLRFTVVPHGEAPYVHLNGRAFRKAH